MLEAGVAVCFGTGVAVVAVSVLRSWSKEVSLL